MEESRGKERGRAEGLGQARPCLYNSGPTPSLPVDGPGLGPGSSCSSASDNASGRDRNSS